MRLMTPTEAIGLVTGSFLGGALSTYCFHGARQLNNAKGFERLGRGGLQGAGLLLATLCIDAFASKIIQAMSAKTNKKQNGDKAVLITHILCGALITAAAKAFPNRLGIPIEAFTNFALSTVLGILGVNIISE